MRLKFFSPLFFSAFTIGLLTAAPAQDDLTDLAKKLAHGIQSIENKKVGVLLFPYVDGKTSSGSSIVAERITTALVGKNKIQIIERRLITKLLQEKYLSETGVVDSDEVQNIGSVLGVDAVVTGTLIDLDNGTTEINARLIRVQTGEVLTAAAGTISRTWNDKPVAPELPKKPGIKKNSRQQKTDAAESATQKLTNTQLSNENFPPSRRKYYSETPAEPKMEKEAADYRDGPSQEEQQRPKKLPPPPNQHPPKPNFIEKTVEEFRNEHF